MLFLIEYDRPKGKLINVRSFAASEKNKAEDARLETELDFLSKGLCPEIVLLEAASLLVLQFSHRRYFKSLKEIGQDFEDFIDTHVYRPET